MTTEQSAHQLRNPPAIWTPQSSFQTLGVPLVHSLVSELRLQPHILQPFLGKQLFFLHPRVNSLLAWGVRFNGILSFRPFSHLFINIATVSPPHRPIWNWWHEAPNVQAQSLWTSNLLPQFFVEWYQLIYLKGKEDKRHNHSSWDRNYKNQYNRDTSGYATMLTYVFHDVS